MPSAPLVPILRQLRRLAAGPQKGQCDADLLGRFVCSRDEIAFEELVRRHGPLVWGVCTRLLRDRHAAEDAFQATFFVLARKAGRLSQPAAVGCWLYGVARRVAGRLRGRPRAEAPIPADIPERKTRSPLDIVTGRELAALLDDELSRLPERLRAPLVLCYLEGQTRDEAAAKLGWSFGTFKRRLEQGRDVLRARLERRGVSLSATLLATVLAEGSASASPLPLTGVVAAAASAFADGATLGLNSGAVVAADSVLHALMVPKVTTVATLFACTLVAGTGWLASRQTPVTPPIAKANGTPPEQVAHADAPHVDRYGDPLPERAVARLGSTRLFHGGLGGGRVAYSADGRMIVSIPERGGTRVWDATTGAEVAVPDVVQSSQVFAAGAGFFAAERVGQGVRFWDVLTGKMVHQLSGPPGNFTVRTVVGVSPDGASFVVGHFDLFGDQRLRFGRIGDEALSEPVVLAANRQPQQIAFSRDAKMAVVRCADGSACTLDMTRHRELASFKLAEPIEIAPNLPVTAVDIALSGDGSMLASASVSEIGLFDPRSGKKLHSIPSDRPLQHVAFSPDGQLLAASYPSNIVRLWNPATGKEVRSIRGQGSQVYGTAFSPDGRTLAMSDGGSTTICDAITGQPLPQFSFGHSYAITGIAFSPDGKSLISGASYTDRTARIWDPLTGALRARLDGHEAGIGDVGFAPDGRLAVTGSQDGTIRVWDVSTNQEVRKLGGNYGRVHRLAVAPDGRTLAATYSAGGVRLWDFVNGRELRALDQLSKQAGQIAFAPDGRTIASRNSTTNALTLIDMASGQTVREFPGHADPLTGFAFSHDGQLIAAGSKGGIIRALDAMTGVERWRLPAIPSDPASAIRSANGMATVNGITFSPDDRTIAAVYDNNAVLLWETASRSVRVKFEGHRDRVFHVAFSPDGSLLASGSVDRTILVWDVTGRLTRRWRPAAEPSAEDMPKLWAELANADATVAFAAAEKLVGSPSLAINELGGRLRPVAAADDAVTRGLIAALNSEAFATRNRAERTLVGLGESVEPALREAMRVAPSPEARARVTAVLERLEPAQSADRLREIRAVEVLERIGTPEARRVLERLAGGAPAARLTREATAALGRTPDLR